MNELNQALEELDWFVSKQFSMWMKFRKNVLLPVEFNSPEEMEYFILKARGELMSHLTGDLPSVSRSKLLFQKLVKNFEDSLKNDRCNNFPSNKK